MNKAYRLAGRMAEAMMPPECLLNQIAHVVMRCAYLSDLLFQLRERGFHRLYSGNNLRIQFNEEKIGDIAQTCH